MKLARKLLRERSGALFVLSFDDRPGKLFDGLEHCRSVIFLSEAPGRGKAASLATTRYHRWPTEAREQLFKILEFAHVLSAPISVDPFPKSASDLQESISSKAKRLSGQSVADCLTQTTTEKFIFYQEATGYWVKAIVGLPFYSKNGVEGPPAHGRFLYFRKAETAQAVAAVLNSSLFYAYFITHGDCFHLSDTLVTGFPAKPEILADPNLAALAVRLMRDLRQKAAVKTIRTKDNDTISYAEFVVSESKAIIDDIDRVLARHYGFTDEELDFIINYDIKYRMGQDADNGEEDE